MNTSLLLQSTLNGLAIGGVYAIFALGYTLVFSILRIINFAHAAIFTVGAYFTYTLTGARFGFNGLLANQALPFGLPFPVALLLGAILAGLLSAAIERLVFQPLRRRNADRLLTLTFFLSGVLGGVAGTLVGVSVSINGPYFGIAFGLKGLAVIVLGGLGDIPGAVAGGLVIGLAEAFVPPQYVAYKDAI